MGEKVYGFHAIEEALKKAGMGSTLYVQRQGGERIESLVREAKLTGKVAVKKLSKDELERMMPGADVRGAILDLGGPRRGASRLIETTVEEFCDRLGENDGALVLILDGKVSSGAAQYVPLSVVTNLTREIKTLKDNGFWIYGADMAGEESYSMSFPARTAIVMGSEGNGISQLVRKNCDHIISIPMRGHIDSLNVSVATGILLYEFRRPR